MRPAVGRPSRQADMMSRLCVRQDACRTAYTELRNNENQCAHALSHFTTAPTRHSSVARCIAFFRLFIPPHKSVIASVLRDLQILLSAFYLCDIYLASSSWLSAFYTLHATFADDTLRPPYSTPPVLHINHQPIRLSNHLLAVQAHRPTTWLIASSTSMRLILSRTWP